jgi:hypothetical protein
MALSAPGRVYYRLLMGGKKTAIACVLITIMAFMWIRVFTRPEPAAAGAAPARTGSVQRHTPVKVKRIELPKSPERHGALQRDFFAAKDGTYFRPKAVAQNTGTDKEVPVASANRVQEVIHRVAQTLKLEAVLWSESPQAFINDQLLSVGSKLTVKDGAAAFEFEVLQIHVDSVLVKCNDTQLTLKLAQFLEVGK